MSNDLHYNMIQILDYQIKLLETLAQNLSYIKQPEMEVWCKTYE